ncbi:ornithine cyclodeaminase family protein [Kytococcus sp. Marseille-QA3725]
MTPQILVLTAEEIDRLLDLETAHRSQRQAFESMGEGSAELAPKVSVPGRDGAALLNYTARSDRDAPGVVKVVGFQPQNPQRGLDPVQGAVMVLSPETGQPEALLDGPALTTPRTAAGSAVAMDLLARTDARVLTVVGAGVQARAHLRALPPTRQLERVHVIGRRAEAAAELATWAVDELGLAADAGTELSEVAGQSDVIALCTTSTTPLLDASSVRPGTLVISVGSFAPDRSEVSVDLVGGADLVVVDDVDTACAQAGCLIDAMEAGAVERGGLVSLGQVATGQHPGRRGDDEVVFYNSVGVAVQDATVATEVLRRAREEGVGTAVPL